MMKRLLRNGAGLREYIKEDAILITVTALLRITSQALYGKSVALARVAMIAAGIEQLCVVGMMLIMIAPVLMDLPGDFPRKRN
jgi:hypothetical protein